MDKIDLAILRELQKDARIRITDLASKVNLSATPCARRVAALEASGVIQQYTALLDQQKVGLPVSIFVAVELKEQTAASIDAFKRQVSEFEEIMEGYLMTGSRDFLMRVVTADLQAYEKFLHDKLTVVPGIQSIRSRFAISQFIRRSNLPDLSL